MSLKASVIAVVALVVGSSAHAGLADLMTCKLSKGGQVHFSSDAQGRVDIALDDVAAGQMGVRGASKVVANMEAKSSATTAGAIELIEIGSTFSGGPDSVCSAGFWLETKNMSGAVQTFGPDRSIPLANEPTYNVLECGDHEQKIVSCTAGKSLSSVSSLKMFLSNEIGD